MIDDGQEKLLVKSSHPALPDRWKLDPFWLQTPIALLRCMGFFAGEVVPVKLFNLLPPKDNRRRQNVMSTPIRRDEVQRLIREEGAQLVEVLPPPEYEEEHIEGAINIPLKELDQDTTKHLDKDRPVIVY